ncbi:hypothetical protein Pmani_039258 [Petrolisthes manimaculis]|uniref:Uncharacterized protein n=1 Tax=Petrolisthes manimaculis TaxID=1843537 RepID=A0AAE1TJM8_9EUCA|nr:hypothetical protein Pmani_039258 [Petrolisthes manimaculis]
MGGRRYRGVKNDLWKKQEVEEADVGRRKILSKDVCGRRNRRWRRQRRVGGCKDMCGRSKQEVEEPEEEEEESGWLLV